MSSYMDKQRLLQRSERVLRGEDGFHELHQRKETTPPPPPPRTRPEPVTPQKVRKVPDAYIYPVDPPQGYNGTAPLYEAPRSPYPSQLVSGGGPSTILSTSSRPQFSFSRPHLRISPYFRDYYPNTSVRLVPLSSVVTAGDQSATFYYDRFLDEVAASTSETNVSPATHDIACAMTPAEGEPEEWRLIRSEEQLAGAILRVVQGMRCHIVRIVWWRRLSEPARFSAEPVTRDEARVKRPEIGDRARGYALGGI